MPTSEKPRARPALPHRPGATGHRRAAARLAVLLLLLAPAGASAQGNLLTRVLRFLGVTVSPGQLKSGGDQAGPGRLFTRDLPAGSERALTAGGGFRWPVFSLDGKTVHALRGGEVVTLDASTGKMTSHRKVPRIDKLVGVDRDQPDQMLVLQTDPAAPIALLSLKTGKVDPLPYDPTNEEQRRMLGHLAGEERVYGTTRLFVQTESKPTMAGTSEWQEIYLQSPDAGPHAISACAGKRCREPALSADGKRAVWVRVGE